MKLSSTQNAPLIRHLKSKTCFNGKALFITNYDYYLNKRDLKIILSKYQEIFIFPQTNNALYISYDEINTLLMGFNNSVIVFNPILENKFNQIYGIVFRENLYIESINVYKFCEDTLRKCYIADKISEQTPTLTNLKYFSFFPRAFKKVVDVSVGSVLWIVTQPIWLISAFKITQESPGPIFFKQKRIGIKNNEFTIIKFRSMGINAEANGAQFSSKNDDRIFPFGKTMRTTRIDELPQLINIVKGELSLIGPRPERRVFIETFEEHIPHYKERHAVKTGISGYAQVMYSYGSSVNDARHKLMYDLYYIKNWSFKLELEILIRTAWTIISKRGI